jgi:hypothetical protein
MPNGEKLADARNSFASMFDENMKSLTGEQVKGITGSGGKFFGKLEGFDEQWVFVRGGRGQAIILRKKKIESIEAV